MYQLLELSWWVDGFRQGFLWWLACVLISVAALPLVMRFFRGLADRGAGVAMGAGIALTVFLAWALAMRWFTGGTEAMVFRAAMLLASAGFVGLAGWRLSVEKRQRRERSLAGRARLYWPAVLFGFLGLVHLPHWGVTIWFAVLLVAVSSALAWVGESAELRRRLRNVAIPFLVAQLCFLFAFVFFLNVRSYIPYATYDTGMSAAEKFGNFTHLNSMMQSSTMPPSDAWFLGEPTNYYYGGHLTVATLAKMTGTPGREAFNFGLATVFGLSFAMGFAFVFNLVQMSPRRFRVGPLALQRGLAWGLLGAFAIAFFGNLDAWQQLATRDAAGVRPLVVQQLELELKISQLKAEGAWRTPSRAELLKDSKVAAPTVEDRLRHTDKLLSDLDRETRDRLNAERQKIIQERLEAPRALRFSAANLAQVDFWRSSRAIKSSPPGEKRSGTITEFPYFSAILGDLHPHHMAIPYSLLILCSVLSLLRRSARMISTDRRWFQRVWPDLIAMGVTIGMVFPVNIWDAVVLAPLLLVALIIALRRVQCGPGWRWIGFAGMLVLLTLLAALVFNLQNGVVVMFGKPAFWLGGIGVLWVGSWLASVMVQRWELRAIVACAAGLLAAAFLAFGGYFAAKQNLVVTGADVAVATEQALEALQLPGAGRVALRDALAFLVLAAVAAWWALDRPSPLKRWWIAVGSAYAVCGFVALFTILPFKLFFHSPLVPEKHLLVSKLPPRVSPTLLQKSGDFWKEFWSRSPINPFQPELRTDLRDYFVHWGLFVIPILFLWLAISIKQTRRWTQGRGFAYWMLVVGVFAFTINSMTKWTGPMTLALSVASLILASARHRRADGAVWVFLTVAFFYHWFVEVLHFDDTYSGYLERYNTPFKIYYPLWAIMAGGMVYGLSRFAELFRPAEREQPRRLMQLVADPAVYAFLVGVFLIVPWILRVAEMNHLAMYWIAGVIAAMLVVLLVSFVIPLARGQGDLTRGAVDGLCAIRTWGLMSPAVLLAAMLFLVGMLYPYSSTALRTRSFFTAPLPHFQQGGEMPIYTQRTLDAIDYMKYKSGMQGDAAAIDWILENTESQARILEAPGNDAYSANGRFAANTGRPTLVGWAHHQMQWRGWGKPVESRMAWRYVQRFSLSELSLHEIAIQVFSADQDAEKAKLKLLATAPKNNLLNRVKEMFPDLSEDEQQRMAEALSNPKAGLITSLALVEKIKSDAERIYRAEKLDEVADLIAFYSLDYVIVGSIERQRYAGPGLEKFKAWDEVFSKGNAAIYRVPVAFREKKEVKG